MATVAEDRECSRGSAFCDFSGSCRSSVRTPAPSDGGTCAPAFRGATGGLGGARRVNVSLSRGRRGRRRTSGSWGCSRRRTVCPTERAPQPRAPGRGLTRPGQSQHKPRPLRLGHRRAQDSDQPVRAQGCLLRAEPGPAAAWSVRRALASLPVPERRLPRVSRAGRRRSRAGRRRPRVSGGRLGNTRPGLERGRGRWSVPAFVPPPGR